MDKTIEITRVPLRSFRINVCAENVRVITGLCSGRSSDTHFSLPALEWIIPTKIFTQLQDVTSQASKLRLVPTSSLYAWCHSHYQGNGGRKRHSSCRSIYFLSQPVQLGWPPRYILHFSTSQAWWLNTNSTGWKVYTCPCEWQIPGP